MYKIEKVNLSKLEKLVLLAIILSFVGGFSLNFFIENVENGALVQSGFMALPLAILWLGGTVWSIVNSFLVMSTGKMNFKRKLFWTLISLLPILFIVYIFL